MVCCLNPQCTKPENPEGNNFCCCCGTRIVHRLRGRYYPVKLLGQGGFGRSYLAVDEDRLQQKCVIKQFSPRLYGTKDQTQSGLAKYVQLFQQEARRLHELGEHPQIPELYAYFAHDSQLYLVQQFVEGHTLAEEVRQTGLFDEQRARSLLLDLLPVLQFVHDRQVVHRDIKPDNILRPSNGQKPFLIDFGVAKQLSGATRVRGGTKVGTEGYAPLEQLRGGQAYPASDLYSLGATCLYLMTGLSPDDLYDPLAGRWIWADRLALRGRALSPAFTALLDRMLADTVSDRYPSARSVLADLKAERSPAGAGLAPDATPQPQTWTCLRLLEGHRDRVQALAFLPDGSRLVSASGDKTLRLWDWTTGELLREFVGHESRVNAAAVSADGRWLVSGSSDRTVRAWDLTDGRLRHVFEHHIDWVGAVAIAPDGRTAISGGDDGKIAWWDLETGKLLHAIKGHDRQASCLAISRDGRWLASGGGDATVRLWNLPARALEATLAHHVGRVTAVAFVPDGSALASGGDDKTIKLWEFRDGHLRSDRPARAFLDHSDAVFALAVHPDGQRLASGSEDCTVKLWHLATGRALSTLKQHTWWVNAVAFSPDGRVLASGSGDRAIAIWQAARSRPG